MDFLSYIATRWSKAMEQQGETIVAALGIVKAFDRIWRKSLLLIMKAFGVDETTLNWI